MPFEHFHMFTTDYSNSLVDLYSIFHTQAKQGGVGAALEAMLLSMTLRYLVAVLVEGTIHTNEVLLVTAIALVASGILTLHVLRMLTIFLRIGVGISLRLIKLLA